MLLVGRIQKATGGFYYVGTGGGIVECRARGLFRKQGISPCVGDEVEIETSPDDGSGYVVDIHPRKNVLMRPPLANLDYMISVISITDPSPNFLIVDTYLALLEYQDIPALIVVTKSDLYNAASLVALYEKSGYRVHVVSAITGEGIPALLDDIAGKFCAVSGNSGVGKSSLLNAINPEFRIDVGDTSKKLGRGRHTTRHVEIFTLSNGAMVADTPGFSALDIVRLSDLRADELDACFLDFLPYLYKCRFDDCRHIHEVGCAVHRAVDMGEISESRYRSYQKLYDEIKDIKEWNRK